MSANVVSLFKASPRARDWTKQELADFIASKVRWFSRD
jgi:hypothetical protein